MTQDGTLENLPKLLPVSQTRVTEEFCKSWFCRFACLDFDNLGNKNIVFDWTKLTGTNSYTVNTT